jgi:dihydrolipoamide dehydrogenase
MVLGVGIVGAGAAELIGEGALAVEMGVELDDLAGTIHPHPSMCELLSDAAR